MIIIIVLLGILSFGIMLVNPKWDNDANFVVGVFLIVISGILLLCSLGAFVSKGYKYMGTDAIRSSYVETLNESRKNGDPIERAAVIKDIMKFNADLAEKQFYLGTMWGIYIDDRFATMKPIKP